MGIVIRNCPRLPAADWGFKVSRATKLTIVLLVTLSALTSRGEARDDPFYARLDHSPRLGIEVGRSAETRYGVECIPILSVSQRAFNRRVTAGSCIERVDGTPTRTIPELVQAVGRMNVERLARIEVIDHDGSRRVFTGYPEPAFLEAELASAVLQQCARMYHIRQLDRRVDREFDELPLTRHERRVRAIDQQRVIEATRAMLRAYACPPLDLP